MDVREIASTADQLGRDEGPPEDSLELLSALTGDLLPDWYEDWVALEREDYRQIRLHALEALCAALTAGRFTIAAQARLAAVAADPLRESAHRVLIGAYLAEGNPSAALRQDDRYWRAAALDLGLAPPEHMDAILKGVREAS